MSRCPSHERMTRLQRCSAARQIGAGTRPHDLDLPFTVWSLRKLATHLVRCGVVKELHATTLGRILRDQGFSFADTLAYLSLDGLQEAVGPRHNDYCNACYTRQYPVEPPPDAEADTQMVFTLP